MNQYRCQHQDDEDERECKQIFTAESKPREQHRRRAGGQDVDDCKSAHAVPVRTGARCAEHI